MLECDWPQHRREQRDEDCSGASDAGASRALAGSKDGSLGTWCEGSDQFSCSTRQRQIIGSQTRAFLVTLDALVRATCIRSRALRSQLDRCWGQNVELGTE